MHSNQGFVWITTFLSWKLRNRNRTWQGAWFWMVCRLGFVKFPNSFWNRRDGEALSFRSQIVAKNGTYLSDTVWLMPAITTPQSVLLIKFFVPWSPCACLLSSQATVAVLCTALMPRHFEARDLEGQQILVSWLQLRQLKEVRTLHLIFLETLYLTLVLLGFCHLESLFI